MLDLEIDQIIRLPKNPVAGRNEIWAIGIDTSGGYHATPGDGLWYPLEHPQN